MYNNDGMGLIRRIGKKNDQEESKTHSNWKTLSISPLLLAVIFRDARKQCTNKSERQKAG